MCRMTLTGLLGQVWNEFSEESKFDLWSYNANSFPIQSIASKHFHTEEGR